VGVASCLLTIVGGVREALLAWRLGRREIVRPRRQWLVLLRGPSASPLGGTGQLVPHSTPHFELTDGVLLKRDAVSGRVLATHKATGTRLVQILCVGDHVVVREDYYQFPRDRSNLYCLDADLQPVWVAERPSHTDAYANAVTNTPDGLECATWECVTCTLDVETGRIRSKVFTK
jgi:hypothetical protein